MPNIAQDTKNSAKSLAQQIAKQLSREPIEILKDVKEQTAGISPDVKDNGKQETFSQPPQGGKNDELNKKVEAGDKMRSGRRMEALNRELEDIHKQKVFSDLQKKISEGVEVSLEEYPELSLEQKQVLKAQMEAVKNQMKMQSEQNKNVLVEPASKKGRQLFNFGKKQAMKNEQTRVEKPVPPSG